MFLVAISLGSMPPLVSLDGSLAALVGPAGVEQIGISANGGVRQNFTLLGGSAKTLLGGGSSPTVCTVADAAVVHDLRPSAPTIQVSQAWSCTTPAPITLAPTKVSVTVCDSYFVAEHSLQLNTTITANTTTATSSTTATLITMQCIALHSIAFNWNVVFYCILRYSMEVMMVVLLLMMVVGWGWT